VRYRGTCCGAVVIGRLVWIALGVPEAEDRCPGCGEWAKFVAETTVAVAEPKPKKLVFGEKAA